MTQLTIDWSVDLLFVQFILVQPVFVQSSPNLIGLDEKLWTKAGWTKTRRTIKVPRIRK